MTFMLSVIGVLLLIVWIITIVDIIRRHYSAGTAVGYIALVVLLPFIGTVIYWAIRKPSQSEVDHAYLAEADRRRSAGARPFDSTGL
jgi:hypothetical protein